MCLYPRLLKNPKYKANKKNGGVIPAIRDERITYVPVGCGNCIECTKQKRRNWQVRLQEDIKTNTTAKFITLTFSNQSYTKIAKEFKTSGYLLDNQIAARATRLFLERYRKQHKKSLRHWLVTELGHEGTEHLHMHGIVWLREGVNWIEEMEDIEKIWSYGMVWKWKIVKGQKTNYVNEKTINYATKYMTKKDFKHKEYKPIVLTSPGIGANYVNTLGFQKNKFNGDKTEETYKTRTGHKIGLPIYWRNKAYTEQEREELWLQKLDKNERWVCGEKVDISQDYTNYYNLLEYHRKRNIELGYGTDEKNWEQKIYENEIRKLKQIERMNNNNKKKSI